MVRVIKLVKRCYSEQPKKSVLIFYEHRLPDYSLYRQRNPNHMPKSKRKEIAPRPNPHLRSPSPLSTFVVPKFGTFITVTWKTSEADEPPASVTVIVIVELPV